MDIYLNRIGYIEKLRPFINKNLIKVIVGQRRVGKSYFIYQIIDELKIKVWGSSMALKPVLV